MKALTFLQKNLVWSVPLFMLLGLLFGANYDAKPLKMAILPLTFLMVYPMMVNLDLSKVFTGGDTKLQSATQAINFLLIPFLGLAVGQIFFAGQPFIILGLLLTSLLPTSGMTISWTGFARGNVAAAVKMTIIGLILGSVLSPFYLQFLLGASVEIPLLEVFVQIIAVVFLPMMLGYATQRLIIRTYGMARYHKDIKQIFPPISTLGVLSVVFVAMALKSKSIIEDPYVLLQYAAPLAILYGINFAISTLIGKYFFSRADGIALVYGSVMRNLSIALAIAMTVFGEHGSEIALIIAIAYIIQVQAGAWYVRYTDTIFGAAPPEIARDIMHRGVFTIHAQQTLRQAIQILEEEHIHSLIVIDYTARPMGILSTRTLFDHLFTVSNDEHQLISSVALKPVLIFDQTALIDNIAQQMQKNGADKVLVQDATGQPIGIITETIYLRKFMKKN